MVVTLEQKVVKDVGRLSSSTLIHSSTASTEIEFSQTNLYLAVQISI